ncbi:hypothetical protein CO051_06190 [Candidatus Roizmanbacteria bacterium CG_4_9_14_0_2_um_filter_39_13]|uniref:Uncharacterized protein n=2 Tax=Candidatus Roizmaniibacteriota TaxID=1752723 RepID=A0A2M8EWU2_9BACT|nr:MAG: hypothetical protein COY15_02635 [Candidatus Roizmanbacteria bacterium CG_4_10_14_0_2_um_filter_39_12]PJC30333.1 MAG: hypothetical protein CO051_06190 [Candidatus Roizmanbacteria bacterium CG_4_9_14_0_2_um_filter_39_13]PJE61667.1 MAG: hypothetical protein COU87_03455 [Candidatus Roizmanbacteria bacterium CG10_big_fil_rev_8_21_14_0_10_39_12]
MDKLTAFFVTVLLMIVNPIEKNTGLKIVPGSLQTPKEIRLTVKPLPYVSPTIAITPKKNYPQATVIPPERFITVTLQQPKKILDTRLPDQKSDVSVSFVKPSASQVFRVDETIEIVAETRGEVNKVEFYVGSGQLLKTFSTEPYQTSFDIGKYVGNIKENYKLPLEVKAYQRDGSSQYAIMTLNIVPVGSDVPQSVPTVTKDISFKEIEFKRDISSTNLQARANGTYNIESYDPFNNMTGMKTKGKAYGLKPNTEYEVFAITKRGSISIGSLPTDGNGYGEFFTGLGTDQHYCDIYQLGIKEKGAADNNADLWSNDLDFVCPKG